MNVRTTFLTAAVAALAAAALGGATALAAPDQGQFETAGWTCFDPDGADGPFGIHCLTPGLGFDSVGEAVALPVIVFADQEGEDFHGTEILRRADAYNGQPCPQEGLDTYEDVGGLPYMACHHPKGGPAQD